MVTPRCECVCCFGGAFRIRLRRTSQRCVCACGCEVNTHEFTHIQLLCYNTAMDNPPKHRSNPIKRLVADHRSSQSQIAECKVRNRAMRIRVTSINYSHFPQTHTHTHTRELVYHRNTSERSFGRNRIGHTHSHTRGRSMSVLHTHTLTHRADGHKIAYTHANTT